MEGNVYLTITDRHYHDILEARNACLSMPTTSGGFDLAILDTWSKITAVQTFTSTLTTPSASDVWLYIGGEAGLGVSDAANKWSRTGMTIDPNLWAFSVVQEPNGPDEHCVIITETYNGLLDLC